ncbi:MAG TPA: flagellar basal body P-ring protein FlgI [Gemmatimonadaceae bacterium]|jgi:flagellar P-ring protein precursor FlgI
MNTGQYPAERSEATQNEAESVDVKESSIKTEAVANSMKGVLRALRALKTTLIASSLVAVAAKTTRAQDMTRVRDLTIEDKAVPVRLMGYGLVIGLDGTGDKSSGGKQGGMSVNSVVNLLKRFGVELPVEALKSKNVAAVLVTAEVSPYLRTGGKFEVHVSSIGDARSLRGGVLYSTPLTSDVGSDAVATAQGAVLMADIGAKSGAVENSARIPAGGLLEIDMPRPKFSLASNIMLKDPDVTMATRIATAINREMGDGTATVEDPGSIALNLKDAKDDKATLFARIQDMRVQTQRVAKLIIDSRDGTIIAGGDLVVGEATVSHGGVTLTIGANDTTAAPPNAVRMLPGTPVTKVASALHAIQAPPNEVAAIFESLRAIGAIACEIEIR